MRSQIFIAACFALLGACASDTSNQGYTPCGDFPSGPVECQPGQYCVDATFSECSPGCTSDVNCAAGQMCVKFPGDSVGDCINESMETPPVCGDGFCDAGESCPADCDPRTPTCGNGVCEAGETRSSCPGDCGSAGPVCGNGVCEAGETRSSCPGDCPGDSPPPPDDTLRACFDHCQAYNFFECFAPGGLQTCRDLCTAATMADREQFDVCASSGAVECNESCFRFLEG